MKASWSSLLIISLSPKLCWGTQLATMPCQREIRTNKCPVSRITVLIKGICRLQNCKPPRVCSSALPPAEPVKIYCAHLSSMSEAFHRRVHTEYCHPSRQGKVARCHSLSPCNGNNCPAEPEPELEGERQGLPTFRSSFGEWASYLLIFLWKLYLWSVNCICGQWGIPDKLAEEFPFKEDAYDFIYGHNSASNNNTHQCKVLVNEKIFHFASSLLLIIQISFTN